MTTRVFISYSHADARLLDRLHKHLAQLKREGSISEWYDREITAGGRIDGEISRELDEADVYLAAVSADFIASKYCYEVELQRALERAKLGDLLIVPIIFEPCDWLATPLGTFKALPEDGKPISEFANENVALLSVTSELRRLIARISAPIERKSLSVGQPSVDDTIFARSRYRIKREHDPLDKRDYIDRAYAEIKRFFEASAQEISAIPELDAEFVDEGRERFSCTVINRGLKRGYETIHVRRGGRLSDIDVAYGERPSESTSSGGLSVKNDEYEMYLSPMFFHLGYGDEKRLTPSDAARMLWDELLGKVGVEYA